MKPEQQLQIAVANFLRTEYPDVLFHSDFGSGTRLSISQAKANKAVNGGLRAWPDMFIAKTNNLLSSDSDDYPFSEGTGGRDECFGYDALGGLFLELKTEGTRLKKKNGDWTTPHIKEQAEMLERLRSEGYAAEFAVGYDEAVDIITDYLGSGKER